MSGAPPHAVHLGDIVVCRPGMILGGARAVFAWFCRDLRRPDRSLRG